jgi:hypothetical protein
VGHRRAHQTAVLFHGLIPPLDRREVRVHNIVIVGSARQVPLSFRGRILQPEFGTSQPLRCAILSPFSIGTLGDGEHFS